MIMKIANFNLQLDLLTGKIVDPTLELMKNQINTQEKIATITQDAVKEAGILHIIPGFTILPIPGIIPLPIPTVILKAIAPQIEQVTVAADKLAADIVSGLGKVAVNNGSSGPDSLRISYSPMES